MNATTLPPDKFVLVIPLREGHVLADMERQMIESTLKHFGQHRRKTAEMLGMGVRTLGMKIAQYREADAFARRIRTTYRKESPLKYRKKTDALEASQWFPPGELNHVPNPLVHQNGDRFYVITEHGSQCQVLHGDWVVAVWGQPERGKVVASDTFAHAWEPVPEPAVS